MKIFGDTHGQYGDLMRLFTAFGAPSDTGDLCATDYLFIGDYVDRGKHQLEVMCLLLALKARRKQSMQARMPACVAKLTAALHVVGGAPHAGASAAREPRD